jgi:hypothetical protein
VTKEFKVTKMKDKKESEAILMDYYEAAKESVIAKMKSEDDERSNLKFKIAALVIHELSHDTPSWFKNYFLSNIAKNDNNTDIIDEKILKVENAFYDVVADHLIKMESEVDYVKIILAPFTEEWDKKEFWKPIVFDAFLIVGIYLSPSTESSINDHNRIKGKQTGRNVSARYLYHTLMPSSVEP